jgi:hypothetical protein
MMSLYQPPVGTRLDAFLRERILEDLAGLERWERRHGRRLRRVERELDRSDLVCDLCVPWRAVWPLRAWRLPTIPGVQLVLRPSWHGVRVHARFVVSGRIVLAQLRHEGGRLAEQSA